MSQSASVSGKQIKKNNRRQKLRKHEEKYEINKTCFL